MTDAVWPDPGDWVARLNTELVGLDMQYMALMQIKRMKADADETENAELTDGDPQSNATLIAASALSAVVVALKEIPTFQGNTGLTALADLGSALLDIDRGRRPAMLQPRAGLAAAGDGTARRFVKAHVVLCVELLELAGSTNAAARKSVAHVFACAGLGGRKGKPLSAQTVYEWGVNLAAHGGDREGRRIINNAIRDWRMKRVWPPVVGEVLAFASKCALDPSIQTKF